LPRKKDNAPVADPHAAREAKNYENPVPSREYMLDIIENHSGPVTHEQMCEILGVTDEDGVEGVRRRLIAMSRDGQIHGNRRGAFGAIDKMNLVRGRVQGHKDGFGFVIDGTGEDDVYLSNRQMRQVFDGDDVVVRVNRRDHRGRREGTIVEVLKHNTRQLVGRLFSESGIHCVRPDNSRMSHDVMVTKDKLLGAKRGDYVVVDITQQPDRRNLPAGEISEVLGEHLAPGMEIDVAIRSHDIPNIWPSAVTAEAESLPDKVDDLDKRKRVDLRKLPFVTIDGEDARDFDDAVYAESKKSGGWRLYVAIADVSHYVAPGSALDVEAVNRGNSVYFPDFVVPMLPEALSNGLCSLNPKVDRLVMVCEMTVSAAGKVSGYKFYEGVIHSHERLTYTKVGQMIAERGDTNSSIRQQYHHVLGPLDTLYDLYQALRAERAKRGAIDFETVETRILFDDNRKIERIVPVHRNDAHKLIEECMLCANVCAAKLLDKATIEALYRVHEGPSGEKLENLQTFLAELGLSMRGKGKPTPAAYQSVLQMVQDRPDAHLIQMVMLRSMSQAKYQPDNQGHFGLSYTAYTHFTSPIRRYPDLLVHRAIRYLLRAGVDGEELTAKVTNNLQPIKGARKLKRKQIYPTI
jgi:ribonuclease R